MKPDGDAITTRQEKAVAALLVEPTIAKAAAAAGVPERTLKSWLRQPAFAAAFRAARHDAFSHAITLTQRYTPHAVQVLAKIMTDQSAPFPSRVTAASALLKFGRESIELDDLAARVDALEALQPQNGPGYS
ncbi:MAG: hypothetical protein AB7O77_17295 [Phycisphaerales bacterium]